MDAIQREAVAVPAVRPRGLGRLMDREEWLWPLMFGPAILYIILLVGAPFFLALYFSVSDITLGSQSLKFVGLRNFAAVVGTSKFRTALTNTFVFAIVAQVVVIILANALALALQRDFWGKWLVRFVILLPWVAPMSLVTIGWLWMLDPIYSPINWTIRAVWIFGPDTWPMWLGKPFLAMATIITIHVWRLLPLATVILLAGLSAIPKDIHDAAAVDGAGFWRHYFQITLPLVRPVLLVASVFSLVFAFTDMIVVYLLTRGGPYDSTQVLASLAFFTGVAAGDTAEGAAVALFLFPVLVAAVIVFLRVARRAEVT